MILNVSVSGHEPSKFALELCSSHSRIVIKAPNGMYLRAEQNGNIQATCQTSRQANTMGILARRISFLLST